MDYQLAFYILLPISILFGLSFIITIIRTQTARYYESVMNEFYFMDALNKIDTISLITDDQNVRTVIGEYRDLIKYVGDYEFDTRRLFEHDFYNTDEYPEGYVRTLKNGYQLVFEKEFDRNMKILNEKGTEVGVIRVLNFLHLIFVIDVLIKIENI